ncbi:hypothetical protein XELAEV_18014596mg [Xenopus laevis]|uniref:Uncharacterized protein n=1 Tax=Xenopus laevis TaxID=8355 RepID=A0A974DGG7_XENLA|nr:hypothetical protein XELAEV_18014596mg [Xenopus laevis]
MLNKVPAIIMGKYGPKGSASLMDKYLCASQPVSDLDTGHEGAATPPPTAEGKGAASQALGHSNADLLQGKKDTHASTSNQLDTIKIEISHIRQDVQTLRECTTEAENRISTLEDKVRSLPAELSRMARQLAEPTAKSADLENRLRRNNLRLIFNTPGEADRWLDGRQR